MANFLHYMRAFSHHSTILLGKHYGSSFPMYFVGGYPRSGTSWFSEMLADYLNLPRPRHYIFPIGFASVIHTHASADSGLDNVFYVIRDGRDSLVSYYFYIAQKMRDENYAAKQRFTRLFGPKFEPDDTDRNLPLFLEDQFQHPLATKQHWGDHSLAWWNRSQAAQSKVVAVRYEDLLANTNQEFARALDTMLGTVDEELACDVTTRQSFNRQRKRPTETHRTFLRKGVAGDWRNYFTDQCAQIFQHYAGSALIGLGYESDDRWVSQVIPGGLQPANGDK